MIEEIAVYRDVRYAHGRVHHRCGRMRQTAREDVPCSTGDVPCGTGMLQFRGKTPASAGEQSPANACEHPPASAGEQSPVSGSELQFVGQTARQTEI